MTVISSGDEHKKPLEPPAMDGRQVKAARALLGWSQAELCRRADISRATLLDIENDTGDPRRSSIQSVEDVFRRDGVVFVDEGDEVVVRGPKFQRPPKGSDQ